MNCTSVWMFIRFPFLGNDWLFQISRTWELEIYSDFMKCHLCIQHFSIGHVFCCFGQKQIKNNGLLVMDKIIVTKLNKYFALL